MLAMPRKQLPRLCAEPTTVGVDRVMRRPFAEREARSVVSPLAEKIIVMSAPSRSADSIDAATPGRRAVGPDGLDQAFRLLDEGVLVVNSVGGVVGVNPAACALLERTETELLTPDYLLELDVRTETGVAVPIEHSFGAQVLATGDAVRDLILSVARRHGSRVWLSVSYQPLTRVGGGAIDGLVLSMRRYPGSGAGHDGPSHSPPRASDRPLTRRERDVIGLIALGYSTAQSASELGISSETVRTHVRNAMSKLGAHSRAQLVALTLSDESPHSTREVR